MIRARDIEINYGLQDNRILGAKSNKSLELVVMLIFILPITLVSNPGNEKIQVFSIVYSTARLMWAILLTYIFIIVVNSSRQSKKFKIDFIVVLLFIRIPLSVVPYSYNYIDNDYINYLAAMVASLVAYVVFKNIVSSDYKKFLNRYVFLLTTIISAQLLFTMINLRNVIDIYNMFTLDLYIKQYLVIPIGASNYIAAFLLVGFTISYVQLSGNKRKDISSILINVISFIGILLTFSRGAIVGVVVIIFIDFFSSNGKHFFQKTGNTILFFCLAAIFIYVLKKVSNIDVLDLVVGKTIQGSSAGLNTMSTGRFEIYMLAFERFKLHPIFGGGWTTNGIWYDNQFFRPHNIFLELLSQSGIVGFIVYLIIIIIVINKLKKYAHADVIIRSILFIVIATLSHGMLEPNLFGFQFDFFFWSIVGIGCSRIKYIRNQQSNLSKGGYEN